VSVLGDIYRGDTRFDFVKIGRKSIVVSSILVALSIVIMLVRPFNLSIDFTGGTIVTAPNHHAATVEEVRAALRAIGQGGATVQVTGEGSDGSILVRTEALSADEQDRFVQTVADVAGATSDEVNVDAVGPTFGAEVTKRAIRALVIFLIAVAVFISWRFEWKMAAAALAALFHDLMMTGGIYALIGFVVTPATVIAVLTILGYSLYDTVVVFDKVTENVTEMRQRSDFETIVNRSMNQVLMRSINTSLTSLLPVGSLLFVGSYALGAETLREFALALFVGIAVGTYSSIFIATPLLALWKKNEPEWQRAARRARRGTKGKKGGGESEPVATAAATTKKKASQKKASQKKASPQGKQQRKKAATPSNAKPRPPKKRKKRR